jgi:hypothetical protein
VCVVIRESLRGATFADGEPVQVDVTFDEADPLAIGFEFHDGDGVAEWLLCRRLVFDAAGRGLTVGDSHGKYRLWPARLRTGVRLRSDGCEVDLYLPTRPLLTFVERTYRLAPRNWARQQVADAVDALLAEVAS